jgi:hypothetical protein
MRIHGEPRSKILPLYVTALAQPREMDWSRPVRPERSVRWKRRLGMVRRKVAERLFPQAAWRPILAKESETDRCA